MCPPWTRFHWKAHNFVYIVSQYFNLGLSWPVHISSLLTYSGESLRVLSWKTLWTPDPGQWVAREGEGVSKGECLQEADALQECSWQRRPGLERHQRLHLLLQLAATFTILHMYIQSASPDTVHIYSSAVVLQNWLFDFWIHILLHFDVVFIVSQFHWRAVMLYK